MKSKSYFVFLTVGTIFIISAVLGFSIPRLLLITDINRTTPLEVGLFSRMEIIEQSGSRVLVKVMGLDEIVLDNLISEYSMKPYLLESKSSYFYVKFNGLPRWSFVAPESVWVCSGSQGNTHWEMVVDRHGGYQKILVQYDY
jgi:hypothetical protein